MDFSWCPGHLVDQQLSVSLDIVPMEPVKSVFGELSTGFQRHQLHSLCLMTVIVFSLYVYCVCVYEQKPPPLHTHKTPFL